MKEIQPSILRGLFSAALDLMLPQRCAACAAPVTSARHPFCELCWQSVLLVDRACTCCGLPGGEGLCPACEGHPPPYSMARSAVEYGGQAAAAIRQLKYGGRSYLCRPLASLLRPHLPEFLPLDMVLPVPLHPRRMRQRGYNQAAVLAGELVRVEELSACYCALERHRDTGSQASLGRDLRLQNLRGAFAASADKVRGARVLLLDDVMTTGATAAACTEALLEAGAREIKVLTLARSPAETPWVP